MQAMGTTRQHAVAHELGVSDPVISDLKKAAGGQPRGKGAKSIPWDAILAWALRRNINLDWLLTGQGSMHASEDQPRVAEPSHEPSYAPPTGGATGAITSARARLMAADGMPIPPERLQDLMLADAVGLQFGAWVRLQVIRRPGSVPRIEAAISKMQKEYERSLEEEARSSPAQGRGNAQSA